MLRPPSLRLLGLLCALLLFSGGCDRAQQLWSSARSAVGAQPSSEGEVSGDAGDADDADHAGDAAVDPAASSKAYEQALQAAEARVRERVAAEQRRRARETADALVAQWADRLASQTAEDGAFIPHEGLTDEDPWTHPLRVHYSEADADVQTLEVRSAGPNGVFDDDDDILRTRETAVERSWWARNGQYAPWAALWLAVGIASAIGMHRRVRSLLGKKSDAPLGGWDVVLGLLCVVVAPLTLAVWILMFLASVFGFIEDIVDVID